MAFAPCTVIPTILDDFNIHIDIFNTLDDNDFFLYPMIDIHSYGYTLVCVITHNYLGSPWSLIQTPSLFYWFSQQSQRFSQPFSPCLCPLFSINKFRVHELLLKLLSSLTSSCTFSESPLCPYPHANEHVWRNAQISIFGFTLN